MFHVCCKSANSSSNLKAFSRKPQSSPSKRSMTLSNDSTSLSWNRLNGGAVWHSRKKLPRSPVDVPECDANAGFSSTMTKSSSHPSRLGAGGACTVEGLPPSSLSDELSLLWSNVGEFLRLLSEGKLHGWMSFSFLKSDANGGVDDRFASIAISGELLLLTKAALVRVLAQVIGLEELAGLLILCFITPLFS